MAKIVHGIKKKLKIGDKLELDGLQDLSPEAAKDIQEKVDDAIHGIKTSIMQDVLLITHQARKRIADRVQPPEGAKAPTPPREWSPTDIEIPMRIDSSFITAFFQHQKEAAQKEAEEEQDIPKT